MDTMDFEKLSTGVDLIETLDGHYAELVARQQGLEIERDKRLLAISHEEQEQTGAVVATIQTTIDALWASIQSQLDAIAAAADAECQAVHAEYDIPIAAAEGERSRMENAILDTAKTIGSSVMGKYWGIEYRKGSRSVKIGDLERYVKLNPDHAAVMSIVTVGSPTVKIVAAK